jgi:ABC-2 type transport system permease protein
MTDIAQTNAPWTLQTRAFTRRHLQQVLRNKVIVFLTVAWPVLWYFLTVEFFINVPEGTDLGPIRAANGINYGLFGAFTVTIAVFAGEFARDLDSHRYRKLRTMPIAPTADLTGRFLAGGTLGVISYAIMILVAYLTGASFTSLTLWTIVILVSTLTLICLVALGLALVLSLVIPKPEYMTTIAVVIVLMSYTITGFNGLSPELIAGNAGIVNYLPNSLATRMQVAVWTTEQITPPEAPDSLEYLGLLAGYITILLAISVLIMQRFAYGRD